MQDSSSEYRGSLVHFVVLPKLVNKTYQPGALSNPKPKTKKTPHFSEKKFLHFGMDAGQT